MGNYISTTRSRSAPNLPEPVQPSATSNSTGTSPPAALPPDRISRLFGSALSRSNWRRQRGAASVENQSLPSEAALGQGRVEQPIAPLATTLSQLPEEVLLEVLQHGDGTTLDCVLAVSRNFKDLTNAARRQQVISLTQRPRRTTQEALHTRLELADIGVVNPNMRGILNTIQPVLDAQPGEPGPLMRNVQAHADLQQRQGAFGEPGSLTPRITDKTTDIGQCNAQQQSHGFGIRTYQEEPGRKYEGAFENGKVHGLGYKVWPDGSRYEGMWENGLSHGQGILVFANGDRYEGTYENGHPRQGRLVLVDGTHIQINLP